MSRFAPKIECTACRCSMGDEKGWFLVSVAQENVFAWTERSTDACTFIGMRRRFSVTDFGEHGEGYPACGITCVHKLLERWNESHLPVKAVQP